MDPKWPEFAQKKLSEVKDVLTEKLETLKQKSSVQHKELLVVNNKLMIAKIRFWQLKLGAVRSAKPWIELNITQYYQNTQWTVEQKITFILLFQEFLILGFEHLVIKNVKREWTHLPKLNRDEARILIEAGTQIEAQSYHVGTARPHESE